MVHPSNTSVATALRAPLQTLFSSFIKELRVNAKYVEILRLLREEPMQHFAETFAERCILSIEFLSGHILFYGAVPGQFRPVFMIHAPDIDVDPRQYNISQCSGRPWIAWSEVPAQSLEFYKIVEMFTNFPAASVLTTLATLFAKTTNFDTADVYFNTTFCYIEPVITYRYSDPPPCIPTTPIPRSAY